MSFSFDHDSGLVEIDGRGRGAADGARPLPVFDLDSSHPLPDLPDPHLAPPGDSSGAAAVGNAASPTHAASSRGMAGAAAARGHQPGELWLQGDVLMCACPDCQAPMSIRLWLMIADCWNCGTSIELTEAQEREARRLLAERDAQRATAGASSAPSPAAPARAPEQPHRPAARPAAAPPRATQPAEPEAPPAATAPLTEPLPDPMPAPPAHANAGRAQPAPSRFRGAPPAPAPAQQPARPARRVPAAARRAESRLQQAKAATVTAWISDLFGMTPAWLISLVFHLVLLTLLALLTLGDEPEDPYITLSTTVAKETREGGETIIVDPTKKLAFDLPIPVEVDVADQRQREALIEADQQARELRIDPDAPDPNLPQLSQVKDQIGGGGGEVGRALAARDPRIRVEMVQQEGGTTLTEAAVARGLRWLANHQNADGSWSIDRFNRSPGCTCTRSGGMSSDAAGTSLALLPFLGAGQTHLVGRYQPNVARGLGWLIRHQKEDGDLRADSKSNSGMYAHGQATIVLCEAFFMTGDEALRAPAQKAVDFIVAAQHPEGGWRYRPGEAGDTSVLGWQLMALQSARAANLTVPPETLELASQYLDSVSHRDGALYAYQRYRSPDHVMTAEALLCRMYLGWTLGDPGLEAGIDYLIDDYLPNKAPNNLYYWYYATQVLHHAGGRRWETWNRQMREILVSRQERRGHEAGSWNPENNHDNTGGRLYATSLATCTLEVYYRHLPLFRQIKLER